ncbi:YheC/YheD family protein [Paenibacillus sp. NPDC058071]|uniref:YheC/YheD family endospore coat-associated protein n=1 Tax=Paenibacillus sp. NPDC058071 TaxID=3346326 RepID=UPI0036D96F43
MNLQAKLGVLVASIQTASPAEEPIFPERQFLARLSQAAEKLPIDLYVFSPAQYDPISGRLTGCVLRRGIWMLERCEWPDVVYDRSLCKNAEERLLVQRVLSQLRERKTFVRLNGSLPSKPAVHDALLSESRIARSLPVTVPLTRPLRLEPLLAQHPEGLFLKPASGMQGKGAVSIRRSPFSEEWLADGRTRSNAVFRLRSPSLSKLEQRLERFVGSTSYIVQPLLELNDEDGRPCDIRSLMQKDGTGSWSVTGIAARVGDAGSVTSNLHGGGTARPAKQQLAERFGERHAGRLLAEIETLSILAAKQLESRFGRLAELGIDFGVDRIGRLWLLEANSRPGRSSFELAGDEEAARLSIERPLHYARLLSRGQQPLLFSRKSKPYAPENDLRPLPIIGVRSDNVQEVHP